MSKRKTFSHKLASKIQTGASAPSSLRLRVLAGVVLTVLAVFLAYYPSLNGGFILDDDVLLTDNFLIKTWDGLYRFWFTTESYDYWPVVNTTFWIEWRLWEMNPTGYHVTNLILHIIDSLLLWLVLRRLSIPGAFLAAMIFALHPVNVESVAWIAQRKNTMAMLFFLLSIFWYLKFLEHAPRPTFSRCPVAAKQILSTDHCISPTFSSFILHPSSLRIWYWLSLAAFTLAMLSKGSVAVLPVVLLGIMWWRRPLTRWDLVKTAPFFAVAAVLAWVNIWFQTHGAGEAIRSAGLAERILGAGGVVWFYLYKTLLPVNLIFVYPQWCVKIGNPLWWLPLLAAVVVSALLWRYRKSWSRPLLFAWGFICLALAPVMGFTDVGFMQYSIVADHYQHIAIIGVVALAAAGWSIWRQTTRGRERSAANAVAIVVLGALLLLTWRQSGLYRDALTLYRATLEKNPGCWMAYNNLGTALTESGRLTEAIENYKQALSLKSNYHEAYNNLGLALFKSGRLPEAIEQYRQALLLKSDYPKAHNNLGAALASTGRLPEAIEHYEQALLINSNYPEAHNNLAAALIQQGGQLQEAIEHCRQALRLDPDYPDAHNYLGLALLNSGQLPGAIEHFQEALRLKPDLAEACANLALAYSRIQQPSKAVAYAQKGIDLARSQRRFSIAKQIEDWLNSYRAGLSDLQNASPPGNPGPPKP